MSIVFYDCPLDIGSPISGLIPIEHRFSLSGQPVIIYSSSSKGRDLVKFLPPTLACQLILSSADLVEATILLRFHGCGFPVVPKDDI